MSQSKRKPYASITGTISNKQDKRLANRHFRRYNKYALLSNRELFYRLRECSNVYRWKSDGLDFYVPGQDWLYYPTRKEEYIKEIERK